VLCAFDLLEIDGADLRPLPIQQRKDRLAKLLHKPLNGVVPNAHYVGDGAKVFREACKLGCEGIVSKRVGSHYRSGRSTAWLKTKNPAAPAVRREAEEDWGARLCPRSIKKSAKQRRTEGPNWVCGVVPRKPLRRTQLSSAAMGADWKVWVIAVLIAAIVSIVGLRMIGASPL
jgi:hypothetical protein